MGRDYKNSGRASAKRKPRQSAPASAWFLAGLALGMGAAVAVHLYHVRLAPQLPPAAAQPAPVQDAETPAAGSRPRFEFYKILPEMEVVVPEDEERALTSRPPQKPADTGAAPNKDRYLLQVASFQNHADADRLKAQLALLGLEAGIQTVEIRDGQTWHRVRVGPFSDRTEITAVRERLRTNGIKAVLLKLSG
jgi:cell division protein FtsN